MKKIFLIIIGTLLIGALQLPMIFAAATISTPPINPLQGVKDSPIYLPGSDAPNKGSYIQDNFLPRVTGTIIAFGGALSLVFRIIGGIQILTAYQGDEGLGKAKKTLTWALVGFVISMLSYAIVQIIVSINFTTPPVK